jgi:hypothetical protein
MAKKNFLNEEQIAELKRKQWSVKPNGCFITLYRDEMEPQNWESYCRIIGQDSSKDEITILIYGSL